MATSILTPITLWRDFDDSLPLNEEVISEEIDGGIIHRKIYFYGRQTSVDRVKIFAHYFIPDELNVYPAVLLFSEAGLPLDMTFVGWLTSRGYAVLGVDYCGDDGTDYHTHYPEDVDYANYARVNRAMYHVDQTAKETSWYEWAAVARYGVRYLRAQPQVTKVGALGIRTGGEVLWKIAPFAELDCFIPICSAGWLAYHGLEKFGNDGESVFSEERQRFIAGVDSQSYAPYCKAPTLLLCAINDKKYNCDRVYDTFQRINPDVEKAILFSARGSGLLGTHTLANLFLFLDKCLKGRYIFISKPIEVSVEEDEDGNLIAKGIYDEDGDIEECGIFYTEGVRDYRSREWTRILGEVSEDENVYTFPLDVYRYNERVLLYSFVRYSNGFSVTSKIKEVALNKPYRNMRSHSREIYGNADGTNGFTPYRQRSRAIADCFVAEAEGVHLVPGYGGILGISSELGLITHWVGEPRYKAPEGAALRFDAYSAEDAECRIIFVHDEEDGKVHYSCSAKIEGGGKWKSILMEAEDFKSELGASLPSFKDVSALILLGENIVFNNIIWL